MLNVITQIRNRSTLRRAQGGEHSRTAEALTTRSPNSEIRNALPVNSKFEIRNSKSYALSLVVTLSYMYVLFLLSSIPGGRENVLLTSPTVANIAHVPAYGLLALLWIFTLRNHGVTEHRSMCVDFLVASGYGALTELHQVWIPGRFPSAFDVMFNVVGSLIFIWLYWWATRQLMAKSRGLRA